MKRTTAIILTFVLFSLIVVPIALAAHLPIDDAWTQSNTTSQNTEFLHVRSSVSGSSCSPTTTTYMKFDLTGISAEIRTVNLTLTYTYVNLGSGASTVSLYSVTDDSWTETTVGSIKPAPVNELTTLVLDPGSPPAVNSAVTFPSTAALAKFFDDERKGDKAASIALRLTGCTAGAPEVRFASSENATVGYQPSLTLLDPTAVTMTETSAQQTNTLPLYAGLGGLALIAVVGVAISRRRTSTR